MNRLPMWFWIIGILALIWNLVGVYQYISMRLITPEQFAQMDEALQQLHNATPAWVVAAFATAVFSGALASVLLLLKKSVAQLFFLISLLAILVQASYILFMSESIQLLGTQAAVLPAVLAIVGIFLLWFSNFSKNRGWLS
ncbi:hypothetical protein [Kangiella sp.]|uniref:hypothetical protein n=1 Tax=Kangiella sp. TaxID=1920245 RepID=UPI0019B361F1|nr:hypothetical protein [Kangiella sp.]MBD3653855.1 hypothetical protein [Kangiella sp.]